MTQLKCRLGSGDCVGIDEDGSLCGECEGCKSCCVCNKDYEEKYLEEYGSFCNDGKTLLEKALEKEKEWDEKVTELRRRQLA